MTGTYKHYAVAATLDRDNTLRLHSEYPDFKSKDGGKRESFELCNLPMPACECSELAYKLSDLACECSELTWRRR